MATLPKKLDLVRVQFDDTCKRRFFFGLAFDMYGGTAGLYDMGPPLCAMKNNFLSLWRQHFVLEEQMCEVDPTSLTPGEVFQASGHVERFNDIMVRDTVTGECCRLDKHLEEWLETKLNAKETKAEEKAEIASTLRDVDTMTHDEMSATVKKFNVLSMKGNPLSESFPFNLMFKTAIGPAGDKDGYMRPELAQGIILNFKRLVDSNSAPRFPFAAAAIGQAFRNEIAPRAALSRVREFTLAEIEHFLNPSDKSHPKFAQVKDVVIQAWTATMQGNHEDPREMSIGDLVASNTIDNESIAYFIARTKLFMDHIGAKYVRFRQHLKKEMAHYAQDCWDAELLTSYGWLECVGIADRSAYDLKAHMKASGKDCFAREEYPEPRMETVCEKKVAKGVVGKALGKETAAFTKAIEALSNEEALALEAELAAGKEVEIQGEGKAYKVTRPMVAIQMKEEKVTGRNFVPSVIEPSFGVGRILYAVMEQSYWIRGDDTGKNEKRAVFSFTPAVAPQKAAVFPLMVKPELEPVVARIRDDLIRVGVTCRSDMSGVSIGRKYSRVDEVGVPFSVTADFENDGAVTLRERDSTKQVRVPIAEVADVVASMCRLMNPRPWADVMATYPEQAAPSS